jgi:hypothetical protein
LYEDEKMENEKLKRDVKRLQTELKDTRLELEKQRIKSEPSSRSGSVDSTSERRVRTLCEHTSGHPDDFPISVLDGEAGTGKENLRTRRGTEGMNTLLCYVKNAPYLGIITLIKHCSHNAAHCDPINSPPPLGSTASAALAWLSPSSKAASSSSSGGRKEGSRFCNHQDCCKRPPSLPSSLAHHVLLCLAVIERVPCAESNLKMLVATSVSP